MPRTSPPGTVATSPTTPDFPLTLVFNQSGDRYDQPWYLGVSHGMAYAQVFRPRDGVRFAQSPSDGGVSNPAWDFQAFVSDYEVGRRYTLVMRAFTFPTSRPGRSARLSSPTDAPWSRMPWACEGTALPSRRPWFLDLSREDRHRPQETQKVPRGSELPGRDEGPGLFHRIGLRGIKPRTRHIIVVVRLCLIRG